MPVRVALGPRMSASTSCTSGHRIWMRSRLRSAVVSSNSRHNCAERTLAQGLHPHLGLMMHDDTHKP